MTEGRQKLVRRGVTIPAYMLALVLVALTTPVVLPLLALSDMLRRSRFALSRAWTFGLIYLISEAVALSAAAWISLRPNDTRERSLRRSALLQQRWSRSLLRLVRWIYRIQLVVEGGDCANDGPFLLLIRHVSPIDNLIPGALIGRNRILPARYVINRMLLRDPSVDVVAGRLGSAFVRAGSEGSLQDIRKVAALARDLGPDDIVVIFPEGALYTPARHAEAIAALREGRDPALAELAASFQRVLPPHLGGTFALLSAAEGVDVVFCAHTGLESAASYGAIARGEPIGTTLRVRLWRVPAAEIPTGRSERGRWLLEQWSEVDRWAGEPGESTGHRASRPDTLAGAGGG